MLVIFFLCGDCYAGLTVWIPLICSVLKLYSSICSTSMMQEGATEEEIDRLPKFKFSRIDGLEKVNGEIQEPFEGIMIECDTDMPMEHVISEDDAVSLSLCCVLCF